MRQALKLHPDSRSPASAIAASVERPRPGLLALRYAVTGALDGIVLPAATAATREDELWRHTCFEAFIAEPGGAGYFEFNVSPSTQWAAYRFDGYRQGIAPAQGVPPPSITLRRTGDGFDLAVALDLSGVEALAGPGAWRLGLSAVIEAAEGGVSYWALAHPAGKADFHHADGFAMQLPPTERP